MLSRIPLFMPNQSVSMRRVHCLCKRLKSLIARAWEITRGLDSDGILHARSPRCSWREAFYVVQEEDKKSRLTHRVEHCHDIFRGNVRKDVMYLLEDEPAARLQDPDLLPYMSTHLFRSPLR